MAAELPAQDSRECNSFTSLALSIKEGSSKEYARIVSVTSEGRPPHVTYWVRTNGQGKYFDPYGLYSEGLATKKIGGKLVWDFREVKKGTFDYYIKFLQTKNRGWLNTAERQGG